MRSPAVPAATHAPSTSPIWPLKRSTRSRSTRPVVPTSPPAASVRRSTFARHVRSTTTASVLNLGVKAINDTTNRVGDDFTPEVSGIFSFANDDKTFGVGLSASYAKRDSGSSSSTVNDWHIQAWDASTGGLNAANRAGAPLYVNNNNTPGIRSTISFRPPSSTRRRTVSCTASRTTSATRSPTRSVSAPTCR